MNVTVLHQVVANDASADDLDVLVQRDAVVAALRAVGCSTTILPITLDLEHARQQLLDLQPDVVFNLVESLGGTDRLMSLATLLLDALEIPYTGVRSPGLFLSANKLRAKSRLREMGLPTPDWMNAESEAFAGSVSPPASSARSEHIKGTTTDLQVRHTAGSTGLETRRTKPITKSVLPGRWIIKPVLEHASFGIDDSSVVAVGSAIELENEIAQREQDSRRPHFAEQYIDGREFNLSLLAGEVLPPAEIEFVSFPADKPRIVGHQAKWEVDSFEYQQTPRRFEFPDSDAMLLAELSGLAIACWDCFELTGYARVDFRVNDAGEPSILEINANPCLSPDAGFAAAVEAAGLTFRQAIERIVESAR